MPIGFPSSPTLNQEWPTEAPRWRWDGAKWVSTGGAVPITARLATVVGTDDVIALRASVPYLASLAAVAAYTGGSPAPTEPAAFTAGQWTAAATSTPGEISFNLTALPADGGSAITALQYRVGTGAAIAFAGTGTGVRVVTAGLTAGVAVDLQVRAVNAVGAGAWSDVKNRTPLAGGSSVSFVGAGTPYNTVSNLTAHSVPVPAGMSVGNLLAVVIGDHSAASSVVASNGQNLTQAVRQVGAIWWVQISGTVPTGITVNFATASDLTAQAIAFSGPTAVAGIVNDEAFAARPTIPYTSDAANAAVILAYVRGHPNEATAAQFNGTTAANHLYKIPFSPVGIVGGIHSGPTGSNNIAMTWSAADTGGRYISVAFRP